jgi:eukaryotic-like serine/threonine-protein kinase
MRAVPGQTWMLVDEFVAAFERSRVSDEPAHLAGFLPAADDPLYVTVLAELVRVDLESAWNRGDRRRLEAYQPHFPRLFDDPVRLAEVAFEECRLRRQAGEVVSRAEYASRFGIELSASSFAEHPAAEGMGVGPAFDDRASRAIRAAGRPTSDPSTAALPLSEFPAAAERFLDFRLVHELGRGAFGRVYLATQGGLADRQVALKITARHLAEPQTLARLQHTNIVPIYSFHRSGGLQAICMPYFGAATLADVLRDLSGRDSRPPSGKALIDTVSNRHAATQATCASAPDTRTVSGGRSVYAADWTLALRHLGELSFVDAVLWIGVRLADALAHAHERGVVHHDLKPANILLSDDGQPMLLDFNLSADAGRATSDAHAIIGGTLPYMAPEHLQALRRGTRHDDARSDIYALGVVLYELLSGRLPFDAPASSRRETIDQMLVDRARPPAPPGHGNRAVSPAVESILDNCLAYDPAARYQTAAALRDDLTRQLENRPLKHAAERSWRERASKWRRRHRHLTSLTAITLAATCMIAVLAAGLAARGQRLAQLTAVDSLQEFLTEVESAQYELNQPDLTVGQIDGGLRLCRDALARYEIVDNPAWQSLPTVERLAIEDRQRLTEGAAELLLSWARTLIQRADASPTSQRAKADLRLASRLSSLAESCFSAHECPRSVLLQQAEIDERLAGQTAHSKALRLRADRLSLDSPRDLYLAAIEQLSRHRYREAMRLLERVTLIEPQAALAWLAFGHCHLQLGDFARANACYSTCSALAPAAYWPYFDRGLASLGAREFRLAKADFDRVIALRDDLPEAWINRGLAKLELGEAATAVADFTRGLDLGTSSTRVYFMRARARGLAGDPAGAAADHAAGLARQPTDETSWVARGVARLSTDPDAALADFEAALRLDARSRAALEDKAHVLAERLGRASEAIETLDRLVACYPEYARGYAGRGVLLARLGRRQAAQRDARDALLRDTGLPTIYQVAGIYALTSRQHRDDRREALRLLSASLRGGYGLDLVDIDPDLASLKDDADFRQVVEAARNLTDSFMAP